ncbi:MAG: phage portal protein [Chloroflexi bacterium]|uniref:Phage portal protein n=1 Tax=Candidatus Chlorohelix allophototropha TaxID=3003348 RepID=A0A8T7M9A4_9CHLR|nr:phage portal protein [Chloroflexota bacterium]WJW68640.1 phage portal protein [Chloroflexota bacterium L227-S17]
MIGQDAAMMYPLRLRGKELNEDDEGRRARYMRYLDFYKGNQWANTVPERAGQRRLTANYARAFIKKGASFLLGAGVRYECADPLAQAALERLSGENSFDLLDYEAAIDSAVLGDGAFKVTLQQDGTVRIRGADVLNLACEWAGDDTRRLLRVTERYMLSADEAFELAGMLPLQGEVEVEECWTEQEFRVRLANDPRLDKVQPNPYGFIPYVVFPNERRPRMFWGDSDLVDILELCSEFNVRMSVMSQLLQFSGNPVLVLEGVDGSDGRLRVGPGAVWELPPDSRAYLLELLGQGGLQAHMDYISALHRALFDLAEMPHSAFARDVPGGVSGVALEMLLYPLVQKVRRKRQIWTEALERRARMGLRLLGFSPDTAVRVIWADILPRDRATLVANEIALVGQGIHSRATANRLLGTENPEAEAEAALAEMQAGANMRKPLQVSGALVQGLAQAAG